VRQQLLICLSKLSFYIRTVCNVMNKRGFTMSAYGSVLFLLVLFVIILSILAVYFIPELNFLADSVRFVPP
jgi:hypothetical protein